jgi:hypothetical protein
VDGVTGSIAKDWITSPAGPFDGSQVAAPAGIGNIDSNVTTSEIEAQKIILIFMIIALS